MEYEMSQINCLLKVFKFDINKKGLHDITELDKMEKCY